MQKRFLTLTIALVLIGAACNRTPTATPLSSNKTTTEPEQSPTQTVEFSKFNSTYQFSGKIPTSWQVEYLEAIDSINIYDPSLPGTNLEQSIIFIRNFKANSFLTLNTVDILNRTEDTVGSHPAVRYEIKKKTGVPNFVSQPPWRNQQHKLIDIRYSSNNPSLFFVIAHKPVLSDQQFSEFIQSLKFYNDSTSWQEPLQKASERVTKKPFGIYVSPTNSPVKPERFTGFHNATDYEILPGEENVAVPVTAVCGGPLRSKLSVGGYGGLATQSCVLDDKSVSVFYGHMKLGSINTKEGEYLAPGDFLGHLGQGFSSETDGERKHLHLGIYQGAGNDIRGYVQSQSDLTNWINFVQLK